MTKYELRVWGKGVLVPRDDKFVWQTYNTKPSTEDVLFDMSLCLDGQGFVAVRFVRDMFWEVSRGQKWAGVYFELVQIGD
jgi:hypothetical protein